VVHRLLEDAVKRVILAVAVVALISAFLSPDLSLSAEGVAIFVGFLIAIAVVLVTFELPALLLHRRQTGETGRLRVLPWAILLAAVFVLVSRIWSLQPGYLYGVVLGVVFLQAVGPRLEGREAATGATFTLILAVIAWGLLSWVRGAAVPLGDLALIVIETALAAIVVAALEAVAFGLMPLRFMPGYVIYRWRRPLWAVLWLLSLFGFIHILIGPNAGYLSDLSVPALLAAMGVFALFGAISVGFWAYFRFIYRPPAEEAAGAAEP
jgi:hypothetical protein